MYELIFWRDQERILAIIILSWRDITDSSFPNFPSLIAQECSSIDYMEQFPVRKKKRERPHSLMSILRSSLHGIEVPEFFGKRKTLLIAHLRYIKIPI